MEYDISAWVSIFVQVFLRQPSIQNADNKLSLISNYFLAVIVKATNGPRYVVGCRRQLDKNKLKSGTRVALDMTTLTIMRYLPREVCGLNIHLNF